MIHNTCVCVSQTEGDKERWENIEPWDSGPKKIPKQTWATPVLTGAHFGWFLSPCVFVSNTKLPKTSCPNMFTYLSVPQKSPDLKNPHIFHVSVEIP